MNYSIHIRELLVYDEFSLSYYIGIIKYFFC